MQLRSLAALSALSFATVVQAQGNEPLRQPANIPIELATALMSAGGLAGPGDPQILIGEMPGWIAAKLRFPKGTEVLGSAFLGTSVVGVVTYPSASDTIVRVFEREFLESGWKSPAPAVSYGGFRPAAMAPSARRTVMLCGDKAMLYVSATKQRATATTIMVRYSATAGQGTPCNPPAMPVVIPRRPYPTLYNPDTGPQTDMSLCYETGSSGSGNTQERLRTGMLPDAIIEHYGKQLADSGWTPTLSIPVRSVMRTWTKRDSAGTALLSLTVGGMARDTLCRQVDLQVSRPPRTP
jgi:hypothetical protein